jgi:hypothetical protein
VVFGSVPVAANGNSITFPSRRSIFTLATSSQKRGFTKANNSQLIRLALSQVSVESIAGDFRTKFHVG